MCLLAVCLSRHDSVASLRSPFFLFRQSFSCRSLRHFVCLITAPRFLLHALERATLAQALPKEGACLRVISSRSSGTS
ncbi:hypothetical protein BD311DRAFT_765500 [Dichomitus squalens]|uniref:Uncharacterized protein n=1 Tax=Dichomitus squalens TaxID=114155 RepID=A0A4Q9MFW9_9APHY|nr:hypothetical protein BD311DRAFT_765500 [Dichomitus squalens]